jgi:hypothetical protein
MLVVELVASDARWLQPPLRSSAIARDIPDKIETSKQNSSHTEITITPGGTTIYTALLILDRVMK